MVCKDMPEAIVGYTRSDLIRWPSFLFCNLELTQFLTMFT